MNNILFKLKKARQADDLQAVERYEYEYFCHRLENIKVGDRVILRQIDNPTHTEEDEVLEVNCGPEIYPSINSFPSPVRLKNNESDWTNFFRIIKFVEEIMEEKKECNHVFQYGYTMDIVVYCVKCKKDADEIYDGMEFNQQEKLVDK